MKSIPHIITPGRLLAIQTSVQNKPEAWNLKKLHSDLRALQIFSPNFWKEMDKMQNFLLKSHPNNWGKTWCIKFDSLKKIQHSLLL